MLFPANNTLRLCFFSCHLDNFNILIITYVYHYHYRTFFFQMYQTFLKNIDSSLISSENAISLLFSYWPRCPKLVGGFIYSWHSEILQRHALVWINFIHFGQHSSYAFNLFWISLSSENFSGKVIHFFDSPHFQSVAYGSFIHSFVGFNSNHVLWKQFVFLFHSLLPGSMIQRHWLAWWQWLRNSLSLFSAIMG